MDENDRFDAFPEAIPIYDTNPHSSLQSTVQNLDKDTSVLGTAEMMEEIQIGSERYNLFTGCPKVNASFNRCTLDLGGLERTGRNGA